MRWNRIYNYICKCQHHLNVVSYPARVFTASAIIKQTVVRKRDKLHQECFNIFKYYFVLNKQIPLGYVFTLHKLAQRTQNNVAVRLMSLHV